jgi:hypothetical protein
LLSLRVVDGARDGWVDGREKEREREREKRRREGESERIRERNGQFKNMNFT